VTFDGGGNLPPKLALARRLVERGHDVRFLGHRSQRSAVERGGFAFTQWERPPDHDTTSSETSPIKDWIAGEPAEVFALVRDTVAFGPAGRGTRAGARRLN
jgi:hypothetical protein